MTSELKIDMFISDTSQSLVREAQNLVSVFDADIKLLPEKKQRSASAKMRDISVRISTFAEQLNSGNIGENDIYRITVDSWRLMFAYEKILNSMPSEEREERIKATQIIFDKLFACIFKLKNNIKIVPFEGKQYEPNRPVKAVNADEFSDDEQLFIIETLEPALVKDGRVLHFAKVILANHSYKEN